MKGYIIYRICVILLIVCKLMEKKLAEINEAFEHMRFEDCLVIIDHTIKKFSKPDKKKQQTISPREIRVINAFKTGCLVSLGKFHEANQIFCT